MNRILKQAGRVAVGLAILTAWPPVEFDEDILVQRYLREGRAALAAHRYAEAENLFWAALRGAQGFGPDDERVIVSLGNPAALHYAEGRLASAERFAKQALEVRERSLDPQERQPNRELKNLVGVYYHEGKYVQAEALLREWLAFRGRRPGADTLEVAGGFRRPRGRLPDPEQAHAS